MRVRHLMSEDKVKEMEALLDTRKGACGGLLAMWMSVERSAGGRRRR